MAFYTLIVAFNGKTYVHQGRFSNLKSFVPLFLKDLPKSALSKDQIQFLCANTYGAEWDQVPNAKHVLRQSIKLDDGDFVVYAIKTPN